MRLNILILILLFSVNTAYCQITHTKDCSIWYDWNGIVAKMYSNDSLIYITKENHRISFKLPREKVDYDDGFSNLRKQLSFNVYKTNEENNIETFFFVLFDMDLKILETRAVDFKPIVSNFRKIAEPYLTVLKDTEGEWKVETKGQKYYLCVFYTLIL